MALVELEDKEYYEHVYKAWRADTLTGEFVEIPAENVRCYNTGYGV